MNKVSFDSHSFLKNLFAFGIESVKPSYLINKLSLEINNLEINNYNIEISNNVYIVGFGKAALGFLNPLYEILKSKFRRGIFSVPQPTEFEIIHNPELFKIPNELSNLTSIYYGSRCNIPNLETIKASSEIYKLIISLTNKDTLIVVITGGGSALLCLPKENITLEDISNISSMLGKSGASIFELNTVRRQLDILKGGGISLLSNSKNVISLILSDVIGDHLSIIASGPTVLEGDDTISPLSVISKYDLFHKVPPHVHNYLQLQENKKLIHSSLDNVFNCIIGNNKIALDAMCKEAERYDMMPFVLTSHLDGDCEQRSREIVVFLEALMQYRYCHDEERKISLYSSACALSFNKEIMNTLIHTIESKMSSKGICLLLGGETPVALQQLETTGKGGRCSHMALTISCLMEKSMLRNSSINMLFGASDGMDGATNCAGAIIYSQMIEDCKLQNLNMNDYLKRFDSYTLFKKFSDGKYFLETGMTGTNVMDFIIIFIPFE